MNFNPHLFNIVIIPVLDELIFTFLITKLEFFDRAVNTMKMHLNLYQMEFYNLLD